MADADEAWKPGSFTKNFSWGSQEAGLSELHSIIRAGFNNTLEDVERDTFRARIKNTGRPDFIPINFFLFNKIDRGRSMICVDELVFQAISWDHGPAFDRLALFAFIFSYVGRWKSAKREQRRPAMWANFYIRERVAKDFHWDERLVTADDIQAFVSNDPRYRAETSRKLSTNFNYLLHIGRIGDFGNAKVSSWWVDCVFLALDRIIEDSLEDGRRVETSQYAPVLTRSGFFDLTGGENSEKRLAVKHLIRLYESLAGRLRFDQAAVITRIFDTLDVQPSIPNDDSPRGAIHRTNPRILKSIPAVCADLARQAGFDILDSTALAALNVETYARTTTGAALALLREKGIESSMTVKEFLEVTRDT